MLHDAGKVVSAGSINRLARLINLLRSKHHGYAGHVSTFKLIIIDDNNNIATGQGTQGGMLANATAIRDK